jgi:hypothetical protein
MKAEQKRDGEKPIPLPTTRSASLSPAQFTFVRLRLL